MNKSSLDKMINTALPYIVGGAVIYVIYKHHFKTAKDVIRANAVAVRSKFSFMSEKEKQAFYKINARNLRADLYFGLNWIVFWDNPSVVALLKSYNEEMLIGVAKEFDNFWFIGKLSTELLAGLSSKDIAELYDVLQILQENNL